MSTRAWPKIKKTTNHGNTVYVVDARIGGKGERRFFASKVEADGWAQLQRNRRLNEGGDAIVSSDLSAYGWTVADAVKFALEHLRQTTASVTVSDAMERLIEAKRAKGRDESYLGDLRRRLTKLTGIHGSEKIATVTVEQMTTFLDGLPFAAETKNTIRRDCVTLWSHAVKIGWAKTNVPQSVERATVIDKPPGILTVKQAEALLAQSEDDLRAFHAIGLFAGLRVCELKRLDWRDVDLEGGFIHVSAANSKTRTRRLVPILPNLHAWLAPLVKIEGRVFESNGRKRHQTARTRAGITEWPDNAMRHSFVSYRLASTGNAAQTALEAGHDQEVLFAHYRELVKPAAAAAYFGLMPIVDESTGNVIQFAA